MRASQGLARDHPPLLRLVPRVVAGIVLAEPPLCCGLPNGGPTAPCLSGRSAGWGVSEGVRRRTFPGPLRDKEFGDQSSSPWVRSLRETIGKRTPRGGARGPDAAAPGYGT